jgi:hypothetical protein
MDKLIALPVSGESFLLRRDDKHVLVDGGYNSRELARALRTHVASLTCLDVVVCTHADRDHSGGLVSLLEHADFSVKELWLPGAWIDVLPELILEPAAVMDGLLNELDHQQGDFTAEDIADLDGEGIERIFEARAAEEKKRARRFEERRVDRNVGEGETDIDGPPVSDFPQSLMGDAPLDLESAREFERARRAIRYRAARKKADVRVAHYWLGLVKTAQIIREIAAKAVLRGVKVRWFDFGEFALTRIASGGEKGFLEPLNSVELRAVPRRATLSYLAKLSAVNEECLAFFAPPDVTRLGVVFCGDSPLGDGTGYGTSFLDKRIAPDFPVVVTAPHHGSQNNAVAYDHLTSWTDIALWVRTGGSAKQPGKWFMDLSSGERACTHCPRSGLTKQKATVGLGGPFWTHRWPWHGPLLRVSAHECECK